jgi:hypothetical protein
MLCVAVTKLCGLGEDVEVDVFREKRLFVVGVRHRQASYRVAGMMLGELVIGRTCLSRV